MWTGVLARCSPRRGTTLLRNSTSLPYAIVSRRYKWSLSKPSPQNSGHGQVIVEEHPTNENLPKNIVELKRSLRTRDIPRETRVNLLREKMADVLEVPVESLWCDEYFQTLDSVFMRFYSETGQIDYILPMDKLFRLFDKTAQFYLDNDRSDFPQYMAVLATKLTKIDSPLPISVLLNIIEIGSVHAGGIANSVPYIFQLLKHTAGRDFSASLLGRLEQKDELTLNIFDVLLAVEKANPHQRIVNADFVSSFIAHIERIFAGSNPAIHEYLDLNKNLHRVQYLTNEIITLLLKQADTASLLHLLKLKADLNSVNSTHYDKDGLAKIIMHLQAHGEHNGFSEIKSILLRQDIDDESLAETLLMQLAKAKDSNESFLSAICEFVKLDSIKFSPSLRLRASLYEASISISQQNSSSEETFTFVKSIYEPFLVHAETPSSVLSDCLLALSAFRRSDAQILLDMTCQDIFEQTGVELSIRDYKTLIDRAIDHKERELALSLFNESLRTSGVHWTDSVDPSVATTLDNLVIINAQSKENITDIFSHFKKIKQHMSVSCTAAALHALTNKMLEEACVGDVIELLKRELPRIKKDAYQKIRVDLPYSTPYRNLFHDLYRFVVSYKDDTTFETNWVLYGELHKYFHIPFKTYLPAIQFFCEADRLNAALLIVRRMKMLSELHAPTNINQPPSRAIYTYLLNVFGEKLYEEGVVEIHEYLKMDTSIQCQDIQVQNTILNAYSNLQNIGKARDLFLTISSKPAQHGGLNEETAQIMIKTYTYSGLPYVKQFWNSLSQYGIYPDYALFKQYVIAHTYHGHIEEAVKLVDQIDDFNLEISSDLLLSMHNYCVEPDKQKEVIHWAIENHKELWDDIKQSGLLKSATQYMPDGNMLASGSEE